MGKEPRRPVYKYGEVNKGRSHQPQPSPHRGRPRIAQTSREVKVEEKQEEGIVIQECGLRRMRTEAITIAQLNAGLRKEAPRTAAQ